MSEGQRSHSLEHIDVRHLGTVPLRFPQAPNLSSIFNASLAQLSASFQVSAALIDRRARGDAGAAREKILLSTNSPSLNIGVRYTLAA